MTNAPYLLPKARAGYRMGHQEVLDHMFFDGLQSPWDGQLMGCFAEANPRASTISAGKPRRRISATESVRRAKERRRGQRRFSWTEIVAGHRQEPQG